MSRPNRIVSFGSAGLIVISGAVCAAVVGGEVGQILGMVLIGLGLILATGLVFLEVGLSEDQERAREERAREEKGEREHGERARAEHQRSHERTPPSRRLKPPSLGRSRDHRRRLS